ncbi:MAG: hypothetical protein AAGA57_11615, partial [Planctomycetota bacterium]
MAHFTPRRRCAPLLPAALLCGAVGMAGLALAPSAGAQDDAAAAESASVNPVPDVVTTDWALDFTVGRLDAVVVGGPDGEPQRYWYLPYKVVNHTGEARFFTPDIDVLTDSGEIRRGATSVHSAKVFDLIKTQKLRNPLLESPTQARGWLAEGEDFALESVAIWKAPEADVDELWVFVSGIYGETVQALDPITGEALTRPALDPIT